MKEVNGLHLHSIYICPPSQEKLAERIDVRSEKHKAKFKETIEKSKEDTFRAKKEHNEQYFALYQERKAKRQVNVLPESSDLPTIIPSLERDIDLHLGKSLKNEVSSTKQNTMDESILEPSANNQPWNLSPAREELYKKYAEIPGFFSTSLINEDLETTFDAVAHFIREKYKC